MGPDYAKYDVDRLRQARRTIDATRYPDRARELDERIAALAAAPATAIGKTAAPLVDRSADLPILRRVGRVLLVIGVLDICLMVYCIVRGISYSSSLNIFAVIAGLALLRGSLRAASIVRWFAWLWPAFAIVFVAAMVTQPADLTWTQLRLAPMGILTSVLLLVLLCGLWWWLTRELGREEVLAALRAAGRPVRNTRIPLALGLVGGIAGMVFMAAMLGGERARTAESIAAQKLGQGYRYHTTGLQVAAQRGGPTVVAAQVTAWNAKEMMVVPVRWTE
ncbi:MAG TPA: hypothetical protein VF861_16930 [Telluria sp.]